VSNFLDLPKDFITERTAIIEKNVSSQKIGERWQSPGVFGQYFFRYGWLSPIYLEIL